MIFQKMRYNFLYFILLFIACSPKIKDAGVDYFAKSNELKMETESLQLGYKEKLQNLRSQRNSIMVQGRTLTEKELAFIDKVNEIIEDQGKLHQFMEDIAKSENAYEPNGKELLYLNEQANQLAKQIQQNISKID